MIHLWYCCLPRSTSKHQWVFQSRLWIFLSPVKNRKIVMPNLSIKRQWTQEVAIANATGQCSPEVPVVGIFAGYSHLIKCQLFLLDKTTENYSLFFVRQISSIAWICTQFGSAGYFTILADYFKIFGEHWQCRTVVLWTLTYIWLSLVLYWLFHKGTSISSQFIRN